MRTIVVIALVFAVLVSGCSSGGGKEAASARRASVLSPPVCDDRSTTIRKQSQGIALGTIITTWRVTNTSQSACVSFGYPRIDVRGAAGWLHPRILRGHLQSAQPAPHPRRVVVKPGASLYFVSEWGDADTASRSCNEFKRAKVWLPGNRAPARLRTLGCISQDDYNRISVGPVLAAL
jgi:Protein of unknown function (DUF4232)